MSKRIMIAGLILAAAGSPLVAEIARGDALRGEQLVRDRGCTTCHAVNGQGGNSAPDLGRRLSRYDSPGTMVSILWNHTPLMWAGGDAGKKSGSLSEGQAADLFAYFSSNRNFDMPGNAKRGKQAFEAKHCASCHGLATRVSADANPVVAWTALRDPIALAQQLWQPPQKMTDGFARLGVRRASITQQEMTDLLVYIENNPQTRGRQARFTLASVDQGRQVLQAKGCAECHSGKLAPGRTAPRVTTAGFVAAMWSHPAIARPALSYEEMGALLSYWWNLEAGGDARRGHQVFAKRGCAQCHPQGTATWPSSTLYAGPVEMLSVLWNHGPAMQKAASAKGLTWPHLSGAEMADLTAMLASQRPPVSAALSEGGKGIGRLSRIQDYR